MIITKDNYKEIECVAEDDLVIFTSKLRYKVNYNFLLEQHCDNDRIFFRLDVDKYDFCSAAYGYETNRGIFPECKENDYEALTRVVKAIFEELEEKEEETIEEEETPKIITRDNYKKVKCVKYDDKINFGEGLSYKVAEDHLSILDCFENEKIFRYLGIEDEKAFCMECYGYETNGGIFPTCKNKDYAALTLVTKALFDKVLEKEGVVKDPFDAIVETVQKVCKEAIEDYYDNVKIIISNSVNINIKL